MPMVIMRNDRRFTGVICEDSTTIVAMDCSLSFRPMLANEPIRVAWTVYLRFSDTVQEVYAAESTYYKID